MSALTSTPSMINYWCRRVWLPSGIADQVRIGTRDGMITSVTAGRDQMGDDHQLEGLVLPGFANAHSHAFHRLLRGRTQVGDDERGSFWTWRDTMYGSARSLDPDQYFRLARAVYTEMIMAGICVVAEFHYLHHAPTGAPYADPLAMDRALAAAAEEAGIRLTLLDTCYLHGGLGPDGYRPLDPVQRRFGDQTIDGWQRRHDQLCSAMPAAVRVGAAVHSVRAVDPSSITTLVQGLTADEPLHLHLSEQPVENESCRAAFGLSPTRLLAECGALSARTSVVHATHLDADDLSLLGRHRVGVVACPTTERDLADGIGPFGELAEAGCPISVGSDSQAVIDLIEETRAVELDQRLRTGRRGWFGPTDQLAMISAAGYAAAGRRGGQIAVGEPADLVAVDLSSLRTAGSRPEQLLMSASAADVTDVVVAGRIQVANRKHGRVADPLGDLLAVQEMIMAPSPTDERSR